jgi:signal transduction histidine kinase/CheY-like chemotaxis protein
VKIFKIFNYRESFSARIFLTFSALSIIATLAFSLFFYRYQRSSLNEKLDSKGELLATLLAHNARLGVFTENSDILEAPVDGILENAEALSVAVYTSDGRVLAMKNRPGSRPVPEMNKWNPGIADSVERSTRPLRLEDKGNFVFWSRVALKPVMTEDEAVYFNAGADKNAEQTIGFVRVIMDGSKLKKSLQTLLLESIIIGLFSLLFGAIIAYLVSGGITRPLNRLTEGVKDFSCGKEYKQINIGSGDEIGNLASAFNEMVFSLKKREEEKAELEEKLRHSQKMEAIGTLAGGVAHDFNNILMAINGYGALLQIELDEGGKLWSYADQIIKAGDRAANLTQRLLAFTRKQIISPKPLLLDEVVRNIEKLLTRLITEDIEINFCLEAGSAVIMADSGQLDQVLINLVANARDAMTQGGEINIATRVTTLGEDFVKEHDQQGAGDYALITVSDNGVGIAEHVMGRIFDPFFTTKEVGKGTGLGLSMVYGIVKQHNGIIEVDTELGRGTTFRIYLPLIDQGRKELHENAPELLPGKMETLLVAEDDSAVMGFLKGLLEGNGYNVIAVTNGEDAVKEFIKFKETIRLVLFDVIMPRKNGKEAFDEIIRIRPDVKAIFISGYTSDVIDWKCDIREDVYLIPKPVQPAVLLAKLREALERG